MIILATTGRLGRVGGERMKKKDPMEDVAVIQVREDGGLGQGGSSAGDEKWP